MPSIFEKCPVPNCKSNYNFQKKSFFRIPYQIERRLKWFEILGMQLKPTLFKKEIRICGDHFEDKAFTDSLRRRLLKFALPIPPKKIESEEQEAIVVLDHDYERIEIQEQNEKIKKRQIEIQEQYEKIKKRQIEIEEIKKGQIEIEEKKKGQIEIEEKKKGQIEIEEKKKGQIEIEEIKEVNEPKNQFNSIPLQNEPLSKKKTKGNIKRNFIETNSQILKKVFVYDLPSGRNVMFYDF